jgi:hypothetical protein
MLTIFAAVEVVDVENLVVTAGRRVGSLDLDNLGNFSWVALSTEPRAT